MWLDALLPWEHVSGDDVGKELVFDCLDLVLERQLSLLQPANQKLIGRTARFERDDLVIELAMLVPQLYELLTQLTIVLTLLHWSRPFPAVIVRALTAVEPKYRPVFDSAQATASGG